MAMLAEPRRFKKRYNIVPRGKALYEDDSRFGTKMLEKMGWSKGKGLGMNEDGNKDFVRVRYKNDAEGLGFEDRDDHWTQHEQSFSALLNNLNGKEDAESNSTDDERPTLGFGFKKASTTGIDESKGKLKEKISGQSLEEKSAQSKARVHYKKFTRGKDLSQYSEKDLANIFGRKEADSTNIYAQFSAITVDNADEEDAERAPAEEKYSSTGIYTSGMSVSDYFKQKMEAFKNRLKNGTNSEESQCGNDGKRGLEVDEENTAEEEVPKKKKKKSKEKTGIVEEEESLNSNENAANEAWEEGPKKRKKNKNKEAVVEDCVTEVLGANAEDVAEEPLKKKKKKKSKESTNDEEVQLVEETVEDNGLSEAVAEMPKKKKKKSKEQHEEDQVNLLNDAIAANGEVEDEVPKKKKKKSKEAQSAHPENQEGEEPEVPKKKRKKMKGASDDKITTNPQIEEAQSQAPELDKANRNNKESHDESELPEELLSTETTSLKKKKKKSKDRSEDRETHTEESPLLDDDLEAMKIEKSKKRSKKDKQLVAADACTTDEVAVDNRPTNEVSERVEIPNILNTNSSTEHEPQEKAKALTVDDLIEKLKSHNVYQISSSCAEKFRYADLEQFDGSNMPAITGYTLHEKTELQVVPAAPGVPVQGNNSSNKYYIATPKGAYYNHVKEVMQARKSGTYHKAHFRVKSWKRKQAFGAI